MWVFFLLFSKPNSNTLSLLHMPRVPEVKSATFTEKSAELLEIFLSEICSEEYQI